MHDFIVRGLADQRQADFLREVAHPESVATAVRSRRAPRMRRPGLMVAGPLSAMARGFPELRSLLTAPHGHAHGDR